MNAVAKRDYRFDNAKILLIFLVVLGHVADNYCDFYAGVRCLFLYVYTFHMPAFLFISGLFSKHLVKQEKLNWKRLIPYPVLCIFLNFFRNFSLYLFDRGKNFHLMKQDGVSWFLWVLFVFYILTWLIKDFPKKNVLLIAVAFALLAGYDSNIGSNFALSRIAVFYPFFYLGYSTKLEHINKILDNKALKIISPFWLVAYGVALFLTIDHGVYWFRKFFTGQNSYKVLFGDHYANSLRLFMEAPVYRFATLVITFVTMFAFLALVPKHKIFALTTAGSRTLAIYFWHLPIATVLMNVGVFHRFAISSLKNCCIFMLAVSLGLTLLFSLPCFSIPLEWITKPGKRKEEKRNKRDGKKLVSQLESQQQEIRKRERLHEPEPRIAVFYPFFYLGYSTKLEHINKILDNKALKIISPFWLVAYGVALFLTIDHGVYWFRKFFTGQNSYKVLFGDHYANSLRLFMEAPVYRFATLVITFVTMFAFLALVPKHKIFALTTAGSRTLAIYFWHLPIATVLMNVGVFHRFAISSLKNCCIFMLAVSLGLTLLFSLPCFSIPLEWITKPGKRKEEKRNKRDGKKLVSQLESQQQEIRKRERLHEPEPIVGTTVHAAAFNPNAGITVDQIVTTDIILGLKSSGIPENIAFANTLLAKRLHIDRLQEEDPVAAQRATDILKSGIARSMQRFQALQQQNQVPQPQAQQQQATTAQQPVPEPQEAASPEHISSHTSMDDLRHLLDLNL